MLPFNEVDLSAVLAASIVCMVIGSLWYSPILFGTSWMNLVGMTKDQCQNPTHAFALCFVVVLVSTFVLALLLALLVPLGLEDGLLFGGLLWAGVAAPVHLAPVIWQGKDTKLFWIASSEHLFCILVSTAILMAWPW